jgi:hypothetical protein
MVRHERVCVAVKQLATLVGREHADPVEDDAANPRRCGNRQLGGDRRAGLRAVDIDTVEPERIEEVGQRAGEVGDGGLSPFPGVSGATTRRVAARAAISPSSCRELPGEAWRRTSGRPSPALR